MTFDSFSPPSLRRRREAPRFDLRGDITRGAGALRRGLADAGVWFNDQRVIREEVLRTARRLWAAEDVAAGAATLQRLWARIDAGDALEPKEQDALDELSREIGAASTRLQRMMAENATFGARTRRVAVAVVVAGWTGLPKAVDPLAIMTDPLAAMEEVEQLLAREFGKPGETAWLELADECLRRIGVSAERPTSPASPTPTPPRARTARAAN